MSSKICTGCHNTAAIIRNLLSKDTKVAAAAAEALGEARVSSAVPRLIAVLRATKSDLVRNAVAIALSDIGDERGYRAILSMVRSPRTGGHVGTLLYALEPYDCSHELGLMTRLLIEGYYEIAREASVIIQGMSNIKDSTAAKACHDAISKEISTSTKDTIPFLRDARKHLRLLLSGATKRRKQTPSKART